MNQTKHTRGIHVSAETVVARSLDAELAIDECHIGRARAFGPGSNQTGKRRLVSCQARSRMRQHAPASRLNDEFLAVFSHEVRSSLGAIHNAATRESACAM